MARPQRLCVAGQAHLLSQSGHNKQALFVDDEDRLHFRECLRACATEYRTSVHAYTLLPDSVHLLLTPSADAMGVSRLMQALGRRYVVVFNRRHGRSGALWEGRFKLALVEGDAHLLRSQRYIETGAVRRGLVSDLLGYPWSSAAHHLGQQEQAWLSPHIAYWQLGNTPFERQAEYRQWLDDGVPEAELQEITLALQRGLPYAGDRYRAQVEGVVGRSLIPRPRGRPKKSTA